MKYQIDIDYIASIYGSGFHLILVNELKRYFRLETLHIACGVVEIVLDCEMAAGEGAH